MKAFYPTADALLEADRDQLAEAVLRHLKTYEGGGTVHQHGGFNSGYYVQVMEGGARGLGPLPTEPEYGIRQPEVSRRIQEIWQRLVTRGYLMHNPGQPLIDWCVITSEGEDLIKTSLAGHRVAPVAVAQMLPREVLHPKLVDTARSAFMRGEFGIAVFQAMKAVEVSVRAAGGFGNDVVGVPLMRRAFQTSTGPLADTTAEGGEQSARVELFAGAIGSYKNPNSHRDVDLNDPAEAVEIILLANHLLRIVDARVKAKTATP